MYEDEDGFLLYQGQQYTDDGFLVKMFPINSVITSGIEPTLSELDYFEAGDVLNSSIMLKLKQKKYNINDRVCVVSGDLENLQGKVVSINESTITVMPAHEDLNVIHQCFFLPAKFFYKLFFFHFKDPN